jgi:putative ABC transport system permease protein
LLAFIGGALGIALTYLGIQLFRSLADGFPNAGTISIDARVLMFTLGLSFLTAILFGLVPALQASSPELNFVIREGDRTRVVGSRGCTRHVLAISEVALAMVLLVGAGLMINTVLHFEHVHPGLDPRNVLIAGINLPEGGKYLARVPGGDMERPSPQVRTFYQQLLERVAAAPGVDFVGMMSQIISGSTFSILGRPVPPPDRRPGTAFVEVSPAFFRTLRIPLKMGRFLTAADNQNTPWAAVVNETFARRYFPNQDPIGQRLLLRYESYHIDEDQPREIVGVIGDVKHFGLREKPPPVVYASYLQQPPIFPGGSVTSYLAQNIFVRVAPRSSWQKDFAADIRKVVANIDPDEPVTDITTMDRFLAHSIDNSQLVMRLLEIFAAMALLLAVIGIYGVMSYFVNERTHEIGIRIALGAERSSVLALITELGLKLAASGVFIGAALAFALTRLIARFLFGVSPADPITFAAVATLLLSIALLACYVPARRAMNVDPMTALRHE